jgi:hypothetical protein
MVKTGTRCCQLGPIMKIIHLLISSRLTLAIAEPAWYPVSMANKIAHIYPFQMARHSYTASRLTWISLLMTETRSMCACMLDNLSRHGFACNVISPALMMIVLHPATRYTISTGFNFLTIAELYRGFALLVAGRVLPNTERSTHLSFGKAIQALDDNVITELDWYFEQHYLSLLRCP